MSVKQPVDYDAIRPRVVEALRNAVGENSTISTEPAYLGRVKAKVVSERLNGMSEEEKQLYLWDALRAQLGGESQWVAFVIAYGTDEL